MSKTELIKKLQELPESEVYLETEEGDSYDIAEVKLDNKTIVLIIDL